MGINHTKDHLAEVSVEGTWHVRQGVSYTVLLVFRAQRRERTCLNSDTVYLNHLEISAAYEGCTVVGYFVALACASHS